MSKRKRQGQRGREGREGRAESTGADVEVGEWSSSTKVRWRAFPGPASAEAHLRVAIEPQAYADVSTHAKSEIGNEICGVLVGEVCEDDRGVFVHVTGTVEGEHASAGAGHVTFTQETWSAIHEVMDRDHTDREIVGWYHSHPGFGVEFSDMDEFIHENFFASQTQVAMVTDPLGGEDAFCVNTDDGIRYLDRVWVGGRERRCHHPQAEAHGAAEGRASADGGALDQLQLRVTQLVQEMEALRGAHHRFLLGIGLVVCLTLVGYVTYGVIDHYLKRRKPPETLGVVPVAVELDGEEALIVLDVKKWELPEALKSDMQKLNEAQQKKILAQAVELEALHLALEVMRQREEALLEGRSAAPDGGEAE